MKYKKSFLFLELLSLYFFFNTSEYLKPII